MVKAILDYIRTLHFVGPDQTKRYYRLFGDLEYDLLSLRTEAIVMSMRLDELKRFMRYCTTISEEEERNINAVSHEMADHLYDRLVQLHTTINTARNFQFDTHREQRSFLLLHDIVEAIMGIEDDATRNRERETIDIACREYSQLNVAELLDLHDGVQDFLALGRRSALTGEETRQWKQRLADLNTSHPLRHANFLQTPELISQRMSTLKRRIMRQQQELERISMYYSAAIRVMRFRN